jgi:predicted Ser/Thr protein kinase
VTREAARFARVKEIYLAAFDIDEAARPTFVARAAGDDPTLAEEVLRLFGYAADPRAPVGGDIAPGLRAVGVPADGDRTESPPPERLGGYRVLRRIGAGGMGVVYEAEQETPRRRVALKVLQASLLGEEALRRFKIEAETLGRLQHPGVAQVYEARHERDACFIAMEFVAGRTFDRWVAEERPDRRRLVETLALVCDGVEHAHLRGVIHRDLKPGNVLVDDAGRPKIIDFGIARAVAADGSAGSRTRFGEVLGTLAYMSPEQASGNPALVDVRSDVYALGALAYQALLGAPPHDVDRLPLAEALRVVAEAPTPRPAARDPRFPRELETVLLTALEKDRERRYRTAAAFAADLRAYLADRPLAAHPPSGWYLARKFARRHRGVVAAAAPVLVSVVGGSIASTYYAFRADASAAESAVHATIARRNEDEATRRGYAALLGAAAAAVDAARPEEAARALDATAPALRGFEYEYLRARLAGCEREFGAEAPLLAAVAFDVRGRLVVGRPGGALTAIDPATGERRDRPTPPGLATFDAHAESESVVAGFADGTVRTFDAEGAPGAVRDLGAGPIRKVLLSPDGRRVLVLARDGAFVWDRDADRAAPFTPSRSARGRGSSFAWSADGARLSSTRGRGSSLFEVESFDATTGFGAGVEHATTERLTAIDYSPDGRFGAFGTAHPSVRVVDLASERLAGYVRGRSGSVLAVRWLADGKRFLVGDAGGAVTLYELGREEPLRGFPGLDVACAALAVDPAERFVAAAGGGRVRLWRLDGATDAAATFDHASYVWAVAFNPSGDLLASAAWDGTLRLWDG